MVEGNENQTNEPESTNAASRRRGGLFGARRSGRGRAQVVPRGADSLGEQSDASASVDTESDAAAGAESAESLADASETRATADGVTVDEAAQPEGRAGRGRPGRGRRDRAARRASPLPSPSRRSLRCSPRRR